MSHILVNFRDGHYTGPLLLSYFAVGSMDQIRAGVIVKHEQKFPDRRVWVDLIRDSIVLDHMNLGYSRKTQ